MPAGGVDDKVVAVIVAFSPDPILFAEVMASTTAQTDAVIVVDNGRGAGLEATAFSERVQRLDMHGNAGVAAAQNAGMRSAFAQGASHVLLLDHDSVAGPGMVAALLAAASELSTGGERVGVVGADYRDRRRPDVSPFVQIQGWRLHRHDEAASPIARVSYLISSGSLISVEAFAAVGPMDERLFIDYIDIEWGLRASQRGWKCFGIYAAKLNHVLGDEPLRIFGKDYPARSPERHYYMVRNAVWLLGNAALPAQWKVVEGLRLLRRSIAYALFAPRPWRHASAMLAGLRDAVRGRMGERRRPPRPASEAERAAGSP